MDVSWYLKKTREHLYKTISNTLESKVMHIQHMTVVSSDPVSLLWDGSWDTGAGIIKCSPDLIPKEM